MYMYACVHTYIYIYICAYTYMYTNIHIYTCTHIYMYIICVLCPTFYNISPNITQDSAINIHVKCIF